jgi:thiamine monophosphate synthase
LVARVRGVLDAGAGVIVREPSLVAGIDPRAVIFHARTPGAAAIASALHLPADFDVAAWRARFAGTLGASAHSPEEAATKAAAGADYVLLSPVVEGRHGRDAIGVGAVKRAVELGARSVFALGGVTDARVQDAIVAGATGVAAMSRIFGEGVDAGAAAERFLEAAR